MIFLLFKQSNKRVNLGWVYFQKVWGSVCPFTAFSDTQHYQISILDRLLYEQKLSGTFEKLWHSTKLAISMLITSWDVFAMEIKCRVIVDPAWVVIVTKTAFEFAACCSPIFWTVNADLRFDSVDLKNQSNRLNRHSCYIFYSSK